MSAPRILFTVMRRILDNGAWGMLFFNGNAIPAPIAVTLEHTYESGPKRVKTPDGVWYCTRRVHGQSTGKGYPAWEIHIPGHEYIDIHIANLETQLDGCLGLGETFADFNPAPGIQQPAIGSSGDAFREFMSLTKGLDGFFIAFQTIPEQEAL